VSGGTTRGGAQHQPTGDLIARLSDDLRPVRRIPSPARAFVVWLVFAAAILLGALALLGLRPEVATHLAGALGPEVVLLLVVGTTSALLAFLAAIPGREPGAAIAAAAVACLAVLAAAYALGPSLPSEAALTAGWQCAARTIVVALAPWLLLLVALRRGATLVPARAGVLAAVAAFFVAAAVLRLVCPQDAREHLLLWHLGPVALGLMLSWLIGRSWLGRWRDAADHTRRDA
jgi:hypothetical protein